MHAREHAHILLRDRIGRQRPLHGPRPVATSFAVSTTDTATDTATNRLLEAGAWVLPHFNAHKRCELCVARSSG